MAKHKRHKTASKPGGVKPKPKSTPLKAPHKTSVPAKSKKLEPVIPFAAEDRILLVGEGDFSFAKSIVEEHGCYDVVATCLDSKDELFEKYKPQAEEHAQYLQQEGQVVLFGVDATKLDRRKDFKQGSRFDRVLFNFPHVGGKSTDVNRQVRYNQELLVKFFESAGTLLAAGGTIVITLFEGEPYTLWNVRDLARHSGLVVIRSFKFQAEAYPGYSHARTLGNIEGGGGWKGEDRDARSYVFGKKDSTGQPVGGTTKVDGGGMKRKRKRKDESSDEDG